MAFRRRRRFRRRRFGGHRRRFFRRARRGSFRRRRGGRLPRPELKAFFFDFTTSSSLTIQHEQPYARILVGTDSNQRIGRRIFVKYIYLKGKFENSNGPASDSWNHQRFIVTQWKTHSDPVAHPILQGLVAGAPYLDRIDTTQQHKEFRIKMDKHYITQNADAAIGAGGRSNQIFVKKMIRINRTIIYRTDTSATPILNDLLMSSLSDSGIAPHPGFDGYYVIRYYDC